MRETQAGHIKLKNEPQALIGIAPKPDAETQLYKQIQINVKPTTPHTLPTLPSPETPVPLAVRATGATRFILAREHTQSGLLKRGGWGSGWAFREGLGFRV